MNVVAIAVPFHWTCDWGIKLFPFTVSKTGVAFRKMVSGTRDVIWGCGTEPGQLLKLKNAAQVVQPDVIKTKTATKTNRTEGRSLKESTRGRMRPPCLRAS